VRHARERARDVRVGLVVRGAVDAASASIDVRHLPDEPAAFAASLFATLHALDDAGVDVIVVEAVPPGEAWWAVADRLQRGATQASRD
jgi:L-threonylcarbamoyladenylate synthase